VKRALSIALLAACSSHVFAADFGVGVSVQSNDAWIYVPIDVTAGFRISPTFGFEYLINDHFSLGGEAEWFYQDLDSDISQTDADVAGTAKLKSNGTATRLIVRFTF
jgi:hypothetical protein